MGGPIGKAEVKMHRLTLPKGVYLLRYFLSQCVYTSRGGLVVKASASQKNDYMYHQIWDTHWGQEVPQ